MAAVVTRSVWVACVLLLLAGIVPLVACGAPEAGHGAGSDGEHVVETTDSEGSADRRQPAAPTTTVSSSPTAGHAVTAGSPEVDQEAVTLAEDFVTFAVAPGPVTLSDVPLAPSGVRLGLGPILMVTLDPDNAADPSAWRLTADPYFRAYTGPFSALGAIRRHVVGRDVDAGLRLSGDLQVSVGRHPHCVGPPMPAPTGLDGTRRVSVQPGKRSIASCLGWFTVDLFVDHGDIVAITLDLWEP